jgi:hypothetical protein
MRMVDCFIPYISSVLMEQTVSSLKQVSCVNKIFLLGSIAQQSVDGCAELQVDSLQSSTAWRAIGSVIESEYILICTKPTAFELGEFAIERMLAIAEDTKAGFIYADHYQTVDRSDLHPAPVIDYQRGSLRDDFDFGSLLLIRSDVMKQAIDSMDTDYHYAALYDLRLRISEYTELLHINEFLYSEVETDSRKSGERLFDYVNPKNRDVQIEMEEVCSAYLKRVGGYLFPQFESVPFDNTYPFEYEATVVIPVKNRKRTIEDAIRSVLAQKASFKYNLIVVDNHSTDGTTEIIDSFCNDKRVIHIIPKRFDLGIGGCWNEAIHHPMCGKFVIQLDSDDVYSGPETIQKVVDAFYKQNCAMIVGTYRMTDFKMQEIPPGVIDHKEWTSDNGRNNALRINGLGAPRAFYTPILRSINLPNTSYGEDYAIGLRISRQWQIGRIYEVLYLCRRWEDNSDAALDVNKMNMHNLYKDRIRTWELQARIALNKKYYE